MNKLPVALQLYGLRDLLQNTPERFEEIMIKVKEMGYSGVEFAGLYGISAETIKDILDKVGLIPISAHVPFEEILSDPDRVINDYGKIGVKYIVIPFLTDEYRPGAAKYGEFLEKTKAFGVSVKENGMTLLYHNHWFEFDRLPDGSFGLDNIFASVSEDLLAVEPDTCWIKAAGQDPVEYIGKYSGRCPVVHLKDFTGTWGNWKDFKFQPIGFGNMVWEPILEESLKVGAEWVVVEQDQHYGIGSLTAADRSRQYLKILGW